MTYRGESAAEIAERNREYDRSMGLLPRPYSRRDDPDSEDDEREEW